MDDNGKSVNKLHDRALAIELLWVIIGTVGVMLILIGSVENALDEKHFDLATKAGAEIAGGGVMVFFAMVFVYRRMRSC